MEALADKVHKHACKESTFHNIATEHWFHTTTCPYVSSSDMLVGTISIFNATYMYVGMVMWNVAMLWNVLSLSVYFARQFFHPATPRLDNYALVGRAPEAYGSWFVCVYLYVCNSCFSETATTAKYNAGTTSLVPRFSMRLHRKCGGRSGEKEREPGKNRSRMCKFNCRKHVRTEGNDAGRR